MKDGVTIINHLYELVETACKSPNNRFGYGIWSHHIIQVIKYSKVMAKEINADAEVVEIAALLHDYSGIRDYSLHKQHHIHSAKDAEELLTEFNYPEKKIKIIQDAIISHRGSIESEVRSKEARCLVNADAMAHIDQVVSLLYYVFNKENLSIEDGKKWVRKKLEKSWAKLDSIGKKIMESKYKVIISILE